MKKLIITVGLPASGKSTWAKEYKQNIEKDNFHKLWYDKKTVDIVDADEVLINKNIKPEDKIKEISRKIYVDNGYEAVIIDGLFLTNKHIIDLLKYLEYDEDELKEIDIIEIHYWIPDRKKCLWNDKYRRDRNSVITIENAIIEEPNLELIKKEVGKENISMIKHDITEKEPFKNFIDKYDIEAYDNRYLKSDNWCLGGSWGNCWGEHGSVSSEPQPSSFKEFDDLLMIICPNISFLQYKKIYNDSVNINTYDESDYYGGSREYAYYQCDLEKLYESLIEMNVIDEV